MLVVLNSFIKSLFITQVVVVFTVWFCIGRVGTSANQKTSESELHMGFYLSRWLH